MVRVEECLRQSFPRDLARLSGDGLRVIVMYLYLTMMFMLGRHLQRGSSVGMGAGASQGRYSAARDAGDLERRHVNIEPNGSKLDLSVVSDVPVKATLDCDSR